MSAARTAREGNDRQHEMNVNASSDSRSGVLITAIVACRNERRYISTCLQSIIDQDLTRGRVEVIVIDGMSEDGTRDIVGEWVRHRAPYVRMIDNPSCTTPAAFNIGVGAAQGQYVAILGAHAKYARDYLKTCLRVLEDHPEVSCAGGPIMSRGRTTFGQAVALAMSHPLGVGNAKHRFPDYEGYAEAVCFPMIRKEIFDTVGLFDEALLRNQDDEFFYRLVQSGGRLYLSSRARTEYFVRDTPGKLFSQYFQYGMWRVMTLKKHGRTASVRQLVPVMFWSTMLLSVPLGLLAPGWWGLTAGAMPAAYGVALLTVGGYVAVKTRAILGALFTTAVAIMHAAYAAGFAWGLVKWTALCFRRYVFVSRRTS